MFAKYDNRLIHIYRSNDFYFEVTSASYLSLSLSLSLSSLSLSLSLL